MHNNTPAPPHHHQQAAPARVKACVRIGGSGYRACELGWSVIDNEGDGGLPSIAPHNHPVHLLGRPKESLGRTEADCIFTPDVPNQQVFQQTVRGPIQNVVESGINLSVFAHGQTGSGKTHTMSGSDKDPGISLLALEEIFQLVESDSTCIVKIAALEIYNNDIYDLLDGYASLGDKSLRDIAAERTRKQKDNSDTRTGGVSAGGGHPFRPASRQTAAASSLAPPVPNRATSSAFGYTSGSGGRSKLNKDHVLGKIANDAQYATHIPFREERVDDVTIAHRVLRYANAKRSAATTSNNPHSSRSHQISLIIVERKVEDSSLKQNKIDETGTKKGGKTRGPSVPTADLRTVQRGALALVDLAGSEGALSDASTKDSGERNREGAAIRTSLAHLTTVIAALGTRNTARVRDHTLTYVLSPFLSTNARIVWLAMVHYDKAAAISGSSKITLQALAKIRQVVTQPRRQIARVVVPAQSAPSVSRTESYVSGIDWDDRQEKVSDKDPAVLFRLQELDTQLQECMAEMERLEALAVTLDTRSDELEQKAVGLDHRHKLLDVAQARSNQERSELEASWRAWRKTKDSDDIRARMIVEKTEANDKIFAELERRATGLVDLEHQLAKEQEELRARNHVLDGHETHARQTEAALTDRTKVLNALEQSIEERLAASHERSRGVDKATQADSIQGLTTMTERIRDLNQQLAGARQEHAATEQQYRHLEARLESTELTLQRSIVEKDQATVSRLTAETAWNAEKAKLHLALGEVRQEVGEIETAIRKASLEHGVIETPGAGTSEQTSSGIRDGRPSQTIQQLRRLLAVALIRPSENESLASPSSSARTDTGKRFPTDDANSFEAKRARTKGGSDSSQLQQIGIETYQARTREVESREYRLKQELETVKLENAVLRAQARASYPIPQ